MLLILPIFIAKTVSFVSQLFNLGAGATWPGEISLNIDPQILQKLLPQFRQGIIIVAGTNGKTTTSLMITQILEKQGNVVVHNISGANLLNGIVSSCIQKSDWFGKINADWGVFEVDENSLPVVISNFQFPISNKKIIIILLNLFRDQLDRYGEVDVIAEKWERAFMQLPADTKLILNADDPLIAHFGKKMGISSVVYFGIEEPKKFLKKKEHATDSTFCLNCGSRLTYSGIYFSHLGKWSCPKCKEKRPKPDYSTIHSPLPGLYNQYNTLAAFSTMAQLGISEKEFNSLLSDFKPAFGRQEEFEIANKKIKIFLSKNPTGFNASLRTVLELKPKAMLLVLNDRIPDGRDVSWIWDVDFETIPKNTSVLVSGDRVYDMGLRIKYSGKTNLIIEQKLEDAINIGLKKISVGESLYVLPTYSAMLEVRKILSGRKIL